MENNCHFVGSNHIMSPCYKCKERTTTCHGNCKRYKDYEKAVREYNVKNWKEKMRF